MEQDFYEIAQTQYATSARGSLLRRILLGFLLLARPLLVQGIVRKQSQHNHCSKGIAIQQKIIH